MNGKLLGSVKQWWWIVTLIFAAGGTYYRAIYRIENHEERISSLEHTVNGKMDKFEEKLDRVLIGR